MTNKNVEEALEEYQTRPLGDVKIMMIEDDEFTAQIALQKLSGEGCIPYSVADGGEALQMVETYSPDLIILDLMLPNMSGEEILRHLKADDELNVIPVIVFSNKGDQPDIDANLEAGADRYLVKSSTDLDMLVDVVKEVVADKVKS